MIEKECPEAEYKTAYFLDKDFNIYTTPLHNVREAAAFAQEHGKEFIGFLNPKGVLTVVEGLRKLRETGTESRA